MTDLLLQPTGNPTQYEVIVGDQIVGRIALFRALRDDSRPGYGRSILPSVMAATRRMASR